MDALRGCKEKRGSGGEISKRPRVTRWQKGGLWHSLLLFSDISEEEQGESLFSKNTRPSRFK
jgi:hypothetical protein